MRILVTPGRLSELAGQFQQVSGGLLDVGHRCQGALASLDWEARQRAGVEGEVQAAVQQARALAERADSLARFLQDAAHRFAEADRQELTLAGGAVLGASAPPPFWRLPEMMWSGQPFLPVPRVVLPSIGTALGGLIAGSLAQATSDLIERVWNWLHGYGWKTNKELAPPLEMTQPGGKLAETILRGFEKLEEKSRPSEATVSAVADGAAVGATVGSGQSALPEQNVSPSQAPAYGHDVPLISQQGLMYQGKSTEWGCTAAATAMVLEYWHRRNPGMGTMSAQEILDANVRQKEFHQPGGMSPTAVHDEVKALGYTLVEDHKDAKFEQLRQDVEKGPVIAVVKLGMQRSGTNHGVVITGISADGRFVRVNDPWDGQSHEYPVETFLASWGADFGKDAPKNNYMVIRP